MVKESILCRWYISYSISSFIEVVPEVYRANVDCCCFGKECLVQTSVPVVPLIDSRFECEGKVYAIAMMRMVFLNENYKSVTGKEALSVSTYWNDKCKKCTPAACNNTNWDEDLCHAPHYEQLADHYLTLHEGILDSLSAEYKDKSISLQIRSSRPKKELTLC